MSVSAIQICHSLMLLVFCLLTASIGFFTSSSTPPSIKRLLIVSPFAAVFFVQDRLSGDYVAYFPDVVMMLVLIVYVAALIMSVRQINKIKNEPKPEWGKN